MTVIVDMFMVVSVFMIVGMLMITGMLVGVVMNVRVFMLVGMDLVRTMGVFMIVDVNVGMGMGFDRDGTGLRLPFVGWLAFFLPGCSRHGRRSEEGAGGCGAAGERLERNRLLGLVRMLRAHMELELVDHLAAQLALGQHPLNCQLENSLGPALEELPGRLIALPARIARIALVGFVLPLVAREHHLVHVGDNDVVTGVNVGRVGWPVLAHQDRGNLGGEAADDLIGSVDHIPLPR